jgi:putative component of toxin-antitoxin plasmid stabilization module
MEGALVVEVIIAKAWAHRARVKRRGGVPLAKPCHTRNVGVYEPVRDGVMELRRDDLVLAV